MNVPRVLSFLREKKCIEIIYHQWWILLLVLLPGTIILTGFWLLLSHIKYSVSLAISKSQQKKTPKESENPNEKE